MVILVTLMHCVDRMKFCFKDYEDTKRWVLYPRLVYNSKLLSHTMKIAIFGYIRHVRGRKKRKRTNNLQPNFREIVPPSHEKMANEEKSDSSIPDPNLIEDAPKIVDNTNDAVDQESLVKLSFNLNQKIAFTFYQKI